jgi:capsular polysaccharide biosynthesis protein
MFFTDFFAPILRQKNLFLITTLISTGIFYGALQLVPKSERTTIYFSIKPLESTEMANIDPVEGAMKITDMISGWAKDPGFRSDILKESGVAIGNFKRKITARKQNRTNLFWTISLGDKEWQHSKKITEATIKVFERNFADFNKNNAFPFAITTPKISAEKKIYPQHFLIILAILLGILTGAITTFLRESGKARFAEQIKDLFPNSPTLQISEKVGAHDQEMVQQFLRQFKEGKLVGTFAEAREYFELPSVYSEKWEAVYPIFLIKLGETSLQELENLRGVFGEKIGLIIFK